MTPTLLYLTCANQTEADTIASALLTKNLIACAKMLPVRASFIWNGALDHSNEILLMMESAQELCEEIETVVRSLHSYDTFVLVGVPVSYMSPKAKMWLQKSIRISH